MRLIFFSGQASYKVSTTEEANAKLEIFPPPSYPYQCSAETGVFCQFPYGLKVENTVHWNCQRRSGKCSPTLNDETASSTRDNKLRFFENRADFHECAACNWTQIPCFIPGIVFTGFVSSSYKGILILTLATEHLMIKTSLSGLEKWEDCQTLCQLVDTCNFFNYGGYKVDQRKRCYLKYGLGRKVEVGVPLRRVFGRKFCRGWDLSCYT